MDEDASTFGDTVVVRLDEDARREAMEAGAVPFEPMPGRLMRGYVTLSAGAVANEEALGQWLARAREHAATLPRQGGWRQAASREAVTP